MDDISDIKELVVRALDRKNVLSKMRAELRAHVFVTIEEEEAGSLGEGLGKKTCTPQREALLNSPEGKAVVELVHEFLDWTNMEFTKKVFEPEISADFDIRCRDELADQLGFDSSQYGPLLLSLIKRGPSVRKSDGPPQFAPGPTSTGPLPLVQSLPLPKLEPLSSKGPLPPVLAKISSPTSAAPVLANASQQGTSAAPTDLYSKEDSSQISRGQVNKESSAGSDSYSLDIESDEGLSGAGIVDDEEDYIDVGGDQKSGQPVHDIKAAGLPPPSSSTPPMAGDLSDSNLSVSSFTPGRIRPGRNSGSRLSSSDVMDSNNQKEPARIGIKDMMSGDRSFGSSRELDGISFDDHAGGLTMQSGELHQNSEISPASSSKEILKPRGLSPLAPLAPLGGKSLAPLAPLGGGHLGPALGPPLSGLGRSKKPDNDIKDELRRAGLLTLPSESYSVDSSIDTDARTSVSTTPQPSNLRPQASTMRPVTGGVYDAEFSVSNSMDAMSLPPDPEVGSRVYRQDMGLSNVSMDLKDPNGLMAVDRSMDDLDNIFDNVDFAETAEWN